MKYSTGLFLLAAASAATPVRSTRRGEVAERAPEAEAFALAFPSFHGTSEEDVARFLSAGAHATSQTTETAAQWKRDAQAAADDATHALALSKRSLYARRAADLDPDFWIREHERADAAARLLTTRTREAAAFSQAALDAQALLLDTLKTRPGTSFAALEAASEEAAARSAAAKRAVDAAAAEAAESYAVVALALRARAEGPPDLEAAAKRAQDSFERAIGREKRVKREAFFANRAARRREATHAEALRLHADFGKG